MTSPTGSPTPSMPPSQATAPGGAGPVWVAVEQTWDGTAIQPAATRERALRWLVERIKPEDWSGFVDALRRAGDPAAAGLPSTPAEGDPRAVLVAFWGEPVEDSETALEFGAGQDQSVHVTLMDVLPADT